MIVAKNVSKSYGPIHALKNFNLEVPEGKVFALLGPNGAGKTTFVKALLDLISINDGEIQISGVSHLDKNVRRGMSYLPEKFSYYEFETIGGAVEFFGRARGLSGRALTEAIDQALSRVGIAEIKKKKLTQISKGQYQRTGLACSMIGDPKILILDEPFSGLDPVGIKEIKDLFVELKNEGRTLLFNSHLLSEMERICDHAAILYEGETLVSGDINEMRGEKTLEDYFYDLVTARKSGGAQ